MTEAQDRYATQFNQSTPMRTAGFKLSFPDAQTVRVDLDPVQPGHRGGLGTEAVNGGVLAALFDLALGCTPALVDPTRRSATVQLSMTFMRPANGDRIWAQARIDRASSSLIFSSASIFDEAGTECARAQGVMRVSKLRWSSGESPAVD